MANEKNSPSMESGKIDKTAPDCQLSNYCLEDGFYVLKKNSRAGLLIQAAREGKPKRVKKLLEAYPSKEAIEEAMDAALKNNNWEMAQLISDFCHDADFETYSECLKKQFLTHFAANQCKPFAIQAFASLGVQI